MPSRARSHNLIQERLTLAQPWRTHTACMPVPDPRGLQRPAAEPLPPARSMQRPSCHHTVTKLPFSGTTTGMCPPTPCPPPSPPLSPAHAPQSTWERCTPAVALLKAASATAQRGWEARASLCCDLPWAVEQSRARDSQSEDSAICFQASSARGLESDKRGTE